MTDSSLPLTAEEVQQIRKAYEDYTGTAEEEDVIALCDTIVHLTFERDALRALCESAEGKVLWRGPANELATPVQRSAWGISPGSVVAVVLVGESDDA